MMHYKQLLLTLLVLLGLGQTLEVRADDFTYNANNYTCMQVGVDKVRFTLPTGNTWRTNDGVQEGYVYVSVDGDPEEVLFSWHCVDYSNVDTKGCKIQAYKAGTFVLVGKVKGGSKTFTNANGEVSYDLDHNDDDSDHYTTTVEWQAPYSMRGKKLKLTVWAHVNWGAGGDWHVPNASSHKELLDWDCPAAPEVNIMLNEPMLSYDRSQINQTMIAYSVTAKSIKWMKLHYTDAITNESYTKDITDKSLVGFVYVPSDRPWKDIYLEAKIVNTENKEVDTPIESAKQTSSMLHHPKNFTVNLTPAGVAELKWSVEEPTEEDISEGDFFEIQRNLTGATDASDPYWTPISMEIPFQQGVKDYTYNDVTLMNQYQGKPVAYRIRRSSTNMWSWGVGSGYQLYQSPSVFVLPQIENATVQRNGAWSDESHPVKFNFNFGTSCDSQGRRPIYNKQDWEDFIAVHKTQDDQAANCVFVLSSEDDWKYFDQRIRENSRLSAVLTCDLEVGTLLSNTFSGTFNGLGHTLTFNYNNSGDYLAPFRHVANGTIRNLTVTGTLKSLSSFAGGIIGQVASNQSATIENCRVFSTISLSKSGDTSSGGFVGIVERGASASFKNCTFHGKLEGNQSNNNGGFVGVALADTKISFEGCLFDPETLPCDMTNCRTFVRADKTATVTFDDKCYYTRNYCAYTVGDESYFVINNETDWDVFVESVNQAGGNKVNAILGADISVSKMVAQNTFYFGTFNGNGHILNVSIKSADESAAPFRFVGDATIKNLRVRGRVEGGIHSAGLIGSTKDDSYKREVYISNVQVSVDVVTNSTHAGGFVGHGHKSNFHINNCLFDGTVTSTASKGEYVGAFIGWESGGNSNAITNCLENGNYTNFAHAGMNYSYNGGNIICYGNNGNNNKNNYTYHNWGEVGSGYNNAGEISLLQTKLGSEWKVAETPFPKTTTVAELFPASVLQGKSAADMSVADLLTVYGDGWKEFGNSVAPVINEVNDYSGVAVWDPRAQLQLRVNMKGENGVTSEIVDLSDNEDALNKNEFTYDLTHKCVEYDFDLIIRRNRSTMNIFGTAKDGVYPDTLVVKVSKLDAGDMKNYRFMNLAAIDSLKTETRQSSVVLNWWTSGGESDFFRLLRRAHTTDANAAWTDTIATNIQQTFWEDKTVQVQQAYDYMVESVTQCEGVHVVKSEIKTGECEPTAMICGYVRMADGTAMAGVEVVIEPEDDITKSLNNAQFKVKTDNAGYFEQKGLKYRGEGRFKVYVPVPGDGKAFTGGGTVKFDTDTNVLTGYNFYQDQYVVYSGNVYYANTSIPVPGVSFKLDGNLMHDGSGHAIETDNQGSFALSIPHGAHSVQAVKDGHIFADKGFLMNPDDVDDKTQYNFEKNVASIYIWDSTTVVLRGRVVGGDIEGSKPLGSSLSKNNLGDSLKIVMQLEGDNTSWLIRNPKDETVKSDSYAVAFGLENAKGERPDTTFVNVTRHTLTIRPDKQTGEYELKLHPAKYKVIEVSAQGYPTLFQQGKVGETIDLAFNVQGDTCEYSRIYHAVPTVEVTQFNAGNEPYFGVKKLKASDNIGNEEWVNLYYYEYLYPDGDTTQEPIDSIGHYSFGYPVFMAGSPYGWMLQACEKYYKNNKTTNEPDIVKLKGGEVTIKNYLIGTNDNDLSKTIELDDEGGASYIFTPQNTTFTLENDMALKNVSITLSYDGSYYDIKPFDGQIMKGYVMATAPKADGRKAIVSGTPKLFDILRDPPGSGSSAYIEEGSKLSYGYSMDVAATVGFSYKSTTGTGADTYQGTVAAPSGAGQTAGTLTHSETTKNLDFKVESNFGFSWAYNYSIDVTERIQTKTGGKWIGGKADLFIGTTENIIVQDAMAVRVIPESMYQLVKLHEGGSFDVKREDGSITKVAVPIGTTKVLAKGTDEKGKPIYLVRDEVMQVSPAVKSTFIHSQNFIENELLPDLMKVRNALLLPKNTTLDAAKKLANQRGYATYISKVDESSDRFGLDYTMVRPDGDETTGDSINALNEEMVTWIGFLAKNEQEKLAVSPSDLVKRYDFDGGMSSIQYNESFSASTNWSRYLRYPGLTGLGNIFESTGLLASFGPLKTLLTKLDELLKSKNGSVNTRTVEKDFDEDGYAQQCVIDVWGSKTTIKWGLIAQANASDKYTSSESYSKKTGFTLSAASKSSLTVDVYRTAGRYYSLDENANAFSSLTLDMLDKVRYGHLTPPMLTYLPDTVKVYSNFVFRTVGGVTCQPYEGQRVTKWYLPGTELDVATIAADKPRIWIDEPVQSNVPFDQPARFTLHIANETDYPDRATMIFSYSLPAGCNPNGARICVDGAPLTGSGTSIVLYPAVDTKTGKVNVFTKEITVYPSDDFDYENLGISLMDPEDPSRVFTANFSAHFIPSAGNVTVTTPSDHWVVNTESPYDGKRKAWYMPVRIEGFNVNGRGFDHVELQYKLTTQGEKDWVSVCSYYASDSLRAKASGVTDTIPSNGIIVASFYGETDPVEQYYDLRAVVYARHAGGFLTSASPILTGIKDTRLPRMFGTPEPIDGILGIGKDIKIAFSEPIASNYLSEINNFEVLGTPVSTNVSTSTSLSFDGNTMGFTQSEVYLKGKNFTVDVMVNPAKAQDDMVVMFHGNATASCMKLGITADRHLSATINGTKVVSDSIVPFNNQLRQIAYTVKQGTESMEVQFFDGGKLFGTKTIPGVYEGMSALFLGMGDTPSECFKGEMLEFRLWNRVLDGDELGEMGGKSLTGYESGLLDYYKLNEGEGDFSYDKASGSQDLWLFGHSWKRPAGISIKMDGKEGVRLDTKQQFNRTKNHDYTLVFWFRTKDLNGTLFSNGEANLGQDDQLNIGLKDGALYVRSSGFERVTDTYVSSGEWHHFAMTVSRSRNVANVYLDKNMVEAFVADSLSGIVGDYLALGATYKNKNTPTDALTGNIDEVGLFESVLPLNLIQDYMTHTPLGTMKSLMFYLDFGRSEHMDNNEMRLEPTGISIKRYTDSQNKVLERRDTLMAVIDDTIVDRTTYAPMNSDAQLANLKYSYVAKDNELLIDLDEPAFTIEKTNVYITVKEIPDLQGNLMASPVTMNLYVYRNPLRWSIKKISETLDYGDGATFNVVIQNLSGQKQNFEISNLPIWITASQTSGTIDALDDQIISLEVSPYINIGTYSEQISLDGDNGMSEPLPISLNIRGDQPNWTVSEDVKKYNQSMMMVARVKISGVVAHSTEDVVAVLDDKQQVLGVANIEVDNSANANEALAYLTIYGYTNDDGTKPQLNFKFFKASTGKVYNLMPEDSTVYVFQRDAIIGSATEPVVLENDYGYVQRMHLNEGWNWVSFRVEPEEEGTTVGEFLNKAAKWEPDDIITSANGTQVQQWSYHEVENRQNQNQRTYKWDDEDQPIDIHPTLMYRIYSSSEKTAYFEGYRAYDSITVHKGWNRIAYLSTINLPIAQALSAYTPQANVGDVIKSQDAFAVATQTGDHLTWKGSLQYLETGKGYMLRRMADSEVRFTYPSYWSGNRYSGTDSEAAPRRMTRTATTMNIVASIVGVETEQGDVLVVYRGAERMAEAVADDEQNFYLSIGSDTKSDEMLTFVLERGDMVVATTSSKIGYEENLVLGTPDEPTAINFTAVDPASLSDGNWYTVSGIQLTTIPNKTGVYIYNGKVKYIKK
ncbi:MAG: hypothetical protein IJ693_01225 [Bacteroidaceae bacterium]|nr:hypothetical protein [Bacteroidaceae bacterium]